MRVAEVTAPSLVQHLSGGGGERLRLHFEAEEGRESDTGAAFTHTHSLTHTHRVSAPPPGLHVRNGRFVQSQEVGLALLFLCLFCRFARIYFLLFRPDELKEQRVISASCTVRAEPLAAGWLAVTGRTHAAAPSLCCYNRGRPTLYFGSSAVTVPGQLGCRSC